MAESPTIRDAILRFPLSVPIREHTGRVLAAMPEHVCRDLLDDHRFVMCECPSHGAVQVPVASPAAGCSGRSVVFKANLVGRPVAFIHWLIAHELAHAYLRNEGRFPGEDPELAADALAAEWGFPRPGSA